MIETFSYDYLVSAIEEARAKTARFYRADLHVHTIDSHDFPSVHSKPGFVKRVPKGEKGLRDDPAEYKRQFLQRAKDRGLRLVAITDHNESDMAEQLSSMSDADLTVLPGIEISVQSNLFPDSEVHIVGIFPQGTSSKQIDKVFPATCGMSAPGKRGPGARTTQPIDQIIATIHELDGICIAAHVSSTSGMRTMVHSQNVAWLQKSYLRRHLLERSARTSLSPDDSALLQKLESELRPLADVVQNAYLGLLAESKFDGIQIVDWRHEQFYTGEHVDALDLAPFPCVVASDAHTLADLGCHGHATYIKMTEVGLQGLHKALQDPGTRIRYDTTVPTEKARCILGMAFEGGSFDGEVIAFSDNLTTLIGGRGTGKSALIEALRFVLCQPTSGLSDRLRKDLEERRDFTLRDAEVKLLFADEPQGDLFVLKRRLGDTRTSCFTVEGTPLPEIQVPASQRIRAEIYGWSEIEELSDSPRKQLALLDRTVPGIEALRLEVQTRLMDLRKNGDRIVALALEIQALLPQTCDAEEVRSQLESLSRPELDAAFASFDKNEAALHALASLKKQVEDTRSWLLDDGRKRELGQALSQALQKVEARLKDYPWYGQLRSIVDQNAVDAQRLYEQVLDALAAVLEEIGRHTSTLEQERKNIEAELNALAEQAGQGDFKTALSRRKDLTERMSGIVSFEKEIQEKQTEIEALMDARRSQVVPALTSARTALYGARLTKATGIADRLAKLRAGTDISIQIDHLADTEKFSAALGYKDKGRYAGLFRGVDKQYLSKDYPGFYARKFSPHEFVDILLSDETACTALAIRYIRRRSADTSDIVRLVEGTVEEEDGEFIEYGPDRIPLGTWPSSEYELVLMEDSEKIWKHLSPRYWDGEVNTYYEAKKLEPLLELELSDIEDRPRILLDGKPIEGLSPGQRCSALIPIILVEGQNPLVVDQPEDNLDNKLVFDLLVDILRSLKEHRQIIVATHNPNLPVSGDAEQVVVFESPSKERCCVADQASIDDENIVQHIKTIMEGGDRAFEMRMKKYGVLRGV